MGNNFLDHSKENINVDVWLYMFSFMPKEEKNHYVLFIYLFFFTALFQPEHLNIKLNTGELFSLLTVNYCKMYKRYGKSSTLK